MNGLFGGSSSSQQSTPKDLTPAQYVGLRPQVADVLSFLMGSGIPQYNPLAGTMSGVAPGPTGPSQSGGAGGAQAQLPQAGPAAASGNLPVLPTNQVGTNYRGDKGYPGQLTAVGSKGKGTNPLQAGATAGATGATGSVAGTNAGLINPAALVSSINPGPSSNYVAPMTQQQTDLMNQIVASVQPGANPLMNAANQQLLQTINGYYLPGQPGANPFLQAAIQAAQYNTQRQFQDVTVPGLLSRYTGGNQQVQGQGSTAFANEANTAALDYEQTQAGTAAQMNMQGYTQERQNQIQAITQANQVTNDQLQRMVTAAQQAALPQLVQDLGIQRGLAQYNTNINNLLEIIRIAGGLSSPTVANVMSGSSNTSPNIVGDLAGLFTGKATG